MNNKDNKNSKNQDEATLRYQQLTAEYDKLKRSDLQDLSADQDLVLAIMNLISIEEHLDVTGAKTQKTAYYQLISELRDLRKQLLKRVLPAYEGEVWCVSKHLLAASYRLLEVGSKQLDLQHEQLAYDYYQQAYQLYNLFWGLAMQIIPLDQQETNNEQPVAKAKNDKIDHSADDFNANAPKTMEETNAINANNAKIKVNAESCAAPSNPSAQLAKSANSWQAKLRNLVQRLVNCCIE